jgi:ABC-type transport system involved in multi-copper enzyme maturation permease subunit
MQHILTIAKITVIESFRDKVFIGLLLFLIFLLGFSAYLSTLSLGDIARVIQNSGMAGMALISLLVTILFGAFSLYREEERSELYVILNRISRLSYIIGRFCGIALIISAFSLISGLALFLLTWLFGGKIAPGIAWAVLWNICEFTMLGGVAFLFYATGIGFTLNTIMVIGIFIIGHSMTEAITSFIALGSFGSPLHLQSVKIISYIMPNFDLFDFRLEIIHDQSLPLKQVLTALAYWFFYLGALLSLAGARLKSRDL